MHLDFSEHIPEKVLVDPGTGLALNVPAVFQGEPFWWEAEPERYRALQAARAKAGIEIDDFPGIGNEDDDDSPITEPAPEGWKP